jgi:hypothetical protein
MALSHPTPTGNENPLHFRICRECRRAPRTARPRIYAALEALSQIRVRQQGAPGTRRRPPPRTLNRDLPPSLIHRSEFRGGDLTQFAKRPLQAEDFTFRWSALFQVSPYQRGFGGAGSVAGRREADCRPDAAHVVQFTIGFRNTFESAIIVVSHMVSRDDSVRDLALKSGCEAVPHPGKADFELIDVHGMLPLGFLDQSSASDLNFRSDFAVNLRGLQRNCA